MKKIKDSDGIDHYFPENAHNCRVIKRRVLTPDEINIFVKEEQKYLSKHLVLSRYVYFHSKYNALYNDDGKINKMLTLIYLKKTKRGKKT